MYRERSFVLCMHAQKCEFIKFPALSSALLIFQTTLQVGDLFAIYFAAASFSIGFVSYLNSHLVQRFGKHLLTGASLVVSTVLSLCFWILIWFVTLREPMP